MKTLLALVLSALTFTASAQIEVYKQAITVTRTGGGQLLTFANSGWFVFDEDSISIVTADARHKQFSVDSYADWTGEAVHSVRVTTNGFIRLLSGRYQDAILKGTITSVVVNYDANKKRVYDRMPASFVVSGASWGSDTNGVHMAEEFRGALVIDSVRTVAANKSESPISDVVESLRQYLLGLHYTEVAPTN